MRLGNRRPFARLLGGLRLSRLTVKNSSSLSEMAAVKKEDTSATVMTVYTASNYMQATTCRLIGREVHEGKSEQIKVRALDDLWHYCCAGIRCGVGQS